MRSCLDEEFASFLLRVGDRCELTISENMVKLPVSIPLLTCHGNPFDNLIAAIFADLTEHGGDLAYMANRATVTPTNGDINILNDKIIDKEMRRSTILQIMFLMIHNIYILMNP